MFRSDLRNIAIVAHVDHGKTTLVDAMLTQSGVFGAHAAVVDRVMDSGDLEREKGITISAKNASIRHGDITFNLIDTPGHADFGGEVERGLTMADGILLLVDASEGPLPQTRFVLRKALARNLPVVVVINKVDRPDARIAEVLDEVYALFIDLDATDDQIEFPVIYCNGRAGQAWASVEDIGTASNLDVLFATMQSAIPAPEYDETHPFQALVTNLTADSYVGRLAICRVLHGTVTRGQTVAWCAKDGSITNTKVTELYRTENLTRVSVPDAGPGDIVAIAGIPQVTIGETIADMDDPRALPVSHVDEPSLSMTLGVNTAPFAGRDGSKLTARMIKDRLDAELVGNVSLRVEPTDRPDAWEVQGRGELQLAVLIETMRREGFELTVGKPQVLTREIDGHLCEPFEAVTIDVPEDYLGIVTQLVALRKGLLQQMTNHGSGWVRMEYRMPSRGLIGFRTQFLTDTRGTGQLHHIFEGYDRWCGPLRDRASGSLVADREGKSTSYAIVGLQARGVLFISPTTDVYEGMVVGENARADDMDVNICKPKQLTNHRASGSDVDDPLVPAQILSLEQALEFIREDECIEVTPARTRIRKVVLERTARARSAKRTAKAA